MAHSTEEFLRVLTDAAEEARAELGRNAFMQEYLGPHPGVCRLPISEALAGDGSDRRYLEGPVVRRTVEEDGTIRLHVKKAE